MSDAFVWFHNSSENPSQSVSFYEKLLGWTPADGPGGMTMLATQNGPQASVRAKGGGAGGWIPHAQVENVDAATELAVTLGGAVLEAKQRGPAGEYSVVRDPGGAVVALWQKA